MQIVPNVHIVPKVTANCYILVDPEGLTVIDAGLPGSQKKILAYVTSLGKAAGDIKRIIITHADLDHYGGLAALQKASGARTYASQVESKSIVQGKSSRQIKTAGFSLRRILFIVLSPFIKATPFQVDEFLTEGQVLPALGGLQVVETPGHTPGHISLYSPSTTILFCGDSIVSDETGLLGSRPGVTWDEPKARASERRQAGLGAKIVCPGHGPVIREAEGKFPV